MERDHSSASELHPQVWYEGFAFIRKLPRTRALGFTGLRRSLNPSRFSSREECGYILPVTEEFFEPSWVTGDPDILEFEEEADDDARAPWLSGGGPPPKREIGYQGATVCEPISGYYDSPISTLDFAGLYPSIMLEKNLCCSSMVPSLERAAEYGFTPDHLHCLSLGGERYFFLKSEVFTGIVPKMLINLKKHRKEAKKKMASFEEGEAQHSYWDGVQASIKVIMNGCYGAFGTKKGGLFPSGKAIAALITSRGRQLIDLIKHEAETRFWVRGPEECGILTDPHEGAPEGASMVRVVYGDTDSIFIDMRTLSRTAAATFSAGLSKWYVGGRSPPKPPCCHCPVIIPTSFNKEFHNEAPHHYRYNENILPRPHDLEFEKIFHPFLLYKKKMYSGIHYEAGSGDFLAGFAPGAGKLKSKGISVVRRDQVRKRSFRTKFVIAQVVEGWNPFRSHHRWGSPRST